MSHEHEERQHRQGIVRHHLEGHDSQLGEGSHAGNKDPYSSKAHQAHGGTDGHTKSQKREKNHEADKTNSYWVHLPRTFLSSSKMSEMQLSENRSRPNINAILKGK
ncbi:hypothetical protein ES703_81750 [subsurface metagenome]